MKRILDLCCGLGGFSAPWRESGHEVVRVDVDPRVRPDLAADVRLLSYPAGSFDVVLAAPPCVEYSRRDMPWTRESAPEPDTSIWLACERVAREINPPVFILECVRGAIPYHGPAGCSSGPRFFWGWFPALDLPPIGAKERDNSRGWVHRLLAGPASDNEARYWARSFIDARTAGSVMKSVLEQFPLF